MQEKVTTARTSAPNVEARRRSIMGAMQAQSGGHAGRLHLHASFPPAPCGYSCPHERSKPAVPSLVRQAQLEEPRGGESGGPAGNVVARRPEEAAGPIARGGRE